MKVSVRDLTTLRAINTLDITAYLRSHGWEEISAFERSSIWTRSVKWGESLEILLPTDKSYRDYTNRIAEILSILEVVEERSQLEILKDITTSSSDIIRMKLKKGEYNESGVPIQQGVAFVEKARDMILAAACTTVDPREYFPRRKPSLAIKYIEKVRLGHTEQGSYVLPIYSPIPSVPAEQGPHPTDLEDPFERKVTKTLAKSLIAVFKTARTSNATGNLDPFNELVPLGVSANLCDAVVGMQQETEADSVDISFNWASSHELREDIERSIVLPKDLIPVIREASRIFKERSPQENVQLIGLPVRLQRGDDDRNGTVTISSLVDGSMRNVRVQLNEEEYKIAIQAHADQNHMFMEGDLVKQGKGLTLRKPQNILVLTDEDFRHIS